MTLDELKTALQVLYDNENEIGIAVYAILKSGNEPPKKLDIDADSSIALKKLFLNSLRDTITDKEELSLLDLSTSDERKNAIYRYDLEVPDELTQMQTVIDVDNLPLLDLDATALSNIKALLIEIGNNATQVVLYKTLPPIHVFGRSSFLLRKSPHRLERVNEEVLRVTPGFHLMRIGEELLVIDLETLERSFGFGDVIMREAALGIDAVEGMQLVQNPEVLRELLEEMKYARRFTKVAKSSPVLRAGVSNASIIEFCKSFPKLVKSIRFNETGDKIVLDTKVSKDLFIKLLMDDFLTSELTNFHYESVAKDSVEAVVEAVEA